MVNKKLVLKVAITSLIFLLAGPAIGCVVIALLLSIVSLDFSGLLIIILPPAYIVAIMVGSFPAFITGVCFAILREKLTDKFSVVMITLILCFFIEFLFIVFLIERNLLMALGLAFLGVISALLIIFFMGYFKESFSF